eukprot:scaffold23261_cov51-Phaeocystis_antarctica.AAC.6
MRAPRAAHVTGWPSWFRAAKETSLGRIATLRGTCRPGLHGPRCARLTSVLGLSAAVEHAGWASRMSFVDPRRSRFRALGAGHARSGAKRAPANSSPRGRGAVPADLDVLWCLARAIETVRPPQHLSKRFVAAAAARLATRGTPRSAAAPSAPAARPACAVPCARGRAAAAPAPPPPAPASPAPQADGPPTPPPPTAVPPPRASPPPAARVPAAQPLPSPPLQRRAPAPTAAAASARA